MTLFDLEVPHSGQTATAKAKKPKLGRYDAIMKATNEDPDPFRTWVEFDDSPKLQRSFNFVDLFSGAGGMTQGFFTGGFQPVGSVEINEIASATHRRNFPNCNHFCGDIQEIKGKTLINQGVQDVHLVAGGPPCQGFSVAGRRDPNDPRNILFKQFVRIVKELQPWYVVMENVPGILTMKGGKVKEAIIEEFAEVGYPNMSVSVLDAAQFKVPQIRPRAFFIANRLGLKNPYPKPQLSTKDYYPIEPAIADLPEYTAVPEINHEWTKHSPEFMERISKVPPGGSLYETYADAFKRQYPGIPCMTIKENHGGTHIHPYLDRVISAREMARLQSFPDTFIFEGSMKKAMWQIGNAVPPRLAECIGRGLYPIMEKIRDGKVEEDRVSMEDIRRAIPQATLTFS